MLVKDTRPLVALSNCFSPSNQAAFQQWKSFEDGIGGATNGETFGSVNGMATLSPALISANGLALAYGAAPLLEEVTLSVAPGEKVGLVGRNGCGKTSLLKILAGEVTADAGEISRRRGLRIGYLPQEFELDGSKSVRENIEAGAADLMDWLSRYETGHRTEAEMTDL